MQHPHTAKPYTFADQRAVDLAYTRAVAAELRLRFMLARAVYVLQRPR